LTDRHEIWHDDALTLLTLLAVKIANFKNLRWRTAVFKIYKIAVSPQ